MWLLIWNAPTTLWILQSENEWYYLPHLHRGSWGVCFQANLVIWSFNAKVTLKKFFKMFFEAWRVLLTFFFSTLPTCYSISWPFVKDLSLCEYMLHIQQHSAQTSCSLRYMLRNLLTLVRAVHFITHKETLSSIC